MQTFHEITFVAEHPIFQSRWHHMCEVLIVNYASYELLFSIDSFHEEID